MARSKSIVETTVSREAQATLAVPAYFLSLTVENVRCFGPKQTLDLSNGRGQPAQWTIVLGNNGVGKTTLLQMIAALAPYEGQLRGFSVPSLFVFYTMKIEVDFKRYGSVEKLYFSADFFFGSRLTEKKEGEAERGVSVEKAEEGPFVAKGFRNIKEIACFAYGAARRMGETALSERNESDPFASLFFDNVELLNAEEWLLQSDYAAHAASNSSARKQAEKRRDEIKDVLIKLLPEVNDIRFAQLTEKQLKPGVEVQTPYGWVSIKNLSLGYKTLIAWMVDFASRMFDRYPDSSNPLAEPAVVLVDEIDLHLHPKWQRTLMSYLSERFPNTQFIATAHSPLVVQAAQDANIVLLKREGDHVVIENNVEAIRNWRVDQILTSDLFGLESARPPQLDNLLEERAKILSKARLTKKSRERLKKIEEEIGELPTGETPEDVEAMDIIRRAAERMKAEGK